MRICFLMLPALLILSACNDSTNELNLTGRWVQISNTCYQLDLAQTGTELTGTLTKPDDSIWNLTGSITGDTFSFQATGADGTIRGEGRVSGGVYIILTFAYDGMREFSYVEAEWVRID